VGVASPAKSRSSSISSGETVRVGSKIGSTIGTSVAGSTGGATSTVGSTAAKVAGGVTASFRKGGVAVTAVGVTNMSVGRAVAGARVGESGGAIPGCVAGAPGWVAVG
jgi:hypothetical protein